MSPCDQLLHRRPCQVAVGGDDYDAAQTETRLLNGHLPPGSSLYFEIVLFLVSAAHRPEETRFLTGRDGTGAGRCTCQRSVPTARARSLGDGRPCSVYPPDQTEETQRRLQRKQTAAPAAFHTSSALQSPPCFQRSHAHMEQQS
ncbi:hypothetical protein SKAU_G00053810 [Synaphobranchus kaupii]|uniref:Uncharacterized protein n=1 Tax=Synaphobranchus kaupii TaxID=118154 RepID=A0A9Q1G408_SYNKA|nr:hypothetical protein SKAU_G00053810 [Synaphobranchus kaupii]